MVLTRCESEVQQKVADDLFAKECGHSTGLTPQKSQKMATAQSQKPVVEDAPAVEALTEEEERADAFNAKKEAIKNAPAFLRRWREYNSADAEAVLLQFLMEYKISPKKLGDMTAAEAKKLEAKWASYE